LQLPVFRLPFSGDKGNEEEGFKSFAEDRRPKTGDQEEKISKIPDLSQLKLKYRITLPIRKMKGIKTGLNQAKPDLIKLLY
jgi:hypothetical protein